MFKQPGANGLGKIYLNGDEVDLSFEGGKAIIELDVDETGKLMLLSNYRANSTSALRYEDYSLVHVARSDDGGLRTRRIPLWVSIVPPLLAIFLALIFKEVILSLFMGVWAGAFIAGGMRYDSVYYIFLSFWEVVEKYVVAALSDGDHVAVIVFSLLIGGMVALISRNGGMAGVVNALARFARTPTSSQFITWLLGVAIFFDDYANTLIVGNTMRSVTDRFRISREKLAYIVDSTAAPVSAVAFITTWIGAELGYISSGIEMLDNFDTTTSAYSIFLSSLKYSFYPILTLIFILFIVFSKRDFGPMYKAERRARTTGQVSNKRGKKTTEGDMEDLTPVAGAKLRWFNAAIPVLVVIGMTVYGLVDTGMESAAADLREQGSAVSAGDWEAVWAQIGNLNYTADQAEIVYATDVDALGNDARQLIDGQTLAEAQVDIQAANTTSLTQKIGLLIGRANSYAALLWASLTGVVAALFLTLVGRIMNLDDSMNTLLMGFKTMLPAVVILALAWALASITGAVYTKDFLMSTLSGSLDPYLMPIVVFVLAAFISFSTGSSWSTMAILYPIAIPVTWSIALENGIPQDVALELLYNVIATVLAASVLGDHCSPISDTTILSSLASDCNHIDHVRTQLPYALTVGVASIICVGAAGYLGGGWLVSGLLLAVALVALLIFVMRVGKRIDVMPLDAVHPDAPEPPRRKPEAGKDFVI